MTQKINSNSNNEAIISVQSLSKTFYTGRGFKRNEIKALRNISFDLKQGRALALVGESGSGKSTVARILTKMYKPTSGQIKFKGKDINTIKTSADMHSFRGAVQMVFQDPFGSLNPIHNVFHHIVRPLKCYGHVKSNKEAKNKVFEILSKVELDPEITAYKFPHQLSGGQRQRVALARTLAVGAQVILADEPTSMLDVSIRIDVLNLLKRIKDSGIAFLYITHDIATARYFAEDVAVLYQGQIVEWGETKEVIDNAKHQYTKLLLSSIPDVNIKFNKPDKEQAYYLDNANVIRQQSSVLSNKITKINDRHFVREQ